MLGKLMKYDFKAMGRIIIPTFGAGIIAAVLIRIIYTIVPSGTRNPFLSILIVFFTTIAAFICIAVPFVSYIVSIVHFYQTFSSKNGYLTFSLPTTTLQKILSKLFVSIIYIFSGIIISIFYLIVMIPKSFSFMGSFFSELSNQGAVGAFLLLLLIIFISFLFSIAFSQMQIYCSIAIGTQFSKARIAGSILGYFIISFAQNIFSTIAMTFIFSNNSFFLNYSLDNSSASAFFYSIIGGLLPSLGISLCFGAILFIAEFIVTNYIFTKRINLV